MATGTEVGKAHAPVWVYVILGLGLLMILVGFMFTMFAPKRDHLTSVAEGVVSKVEDKESTNKKGRTTHSYITYVKFEDSDHQVFEARSVVNGGSMRHTTGDVVTVHFDPRDPSAGCFIEGDEDRLFMFNALEVVFKIGGPLLLVFGAVAFLICRRKASATQ